MKKSKFYLVIALTAMSVVFTNCKKDEDPVTPPAGKTYDAIITADIIPTEGPVTKITYPTNATPTSANIVIEYASTTETIKDARVYFDVRATAIYVKDNKVKGKNEDSFTQTGVTISMVDHDAVDVEDGTDITGNTSTEGTKVTFYIRIETDEDINEYYYGNDGTMYLDVVADDTDDNITDDFKADPTLWSNYTVQIAK